MQMRWRLHPPMRKLYQAFSFGREDVVAEFEDKLLEFGAISVAIFAALYDSQASHFGSPFSRPPTLRCESKHVGQNPFLFLLKGSCVQAPPSAELGVRPLLTDRRRPATSHYGIIVSCRGAIGPLTRCGCSLRNPSRVVVSCRGPDVPRGQMVH